MLEPIEIIGVSYHRERDFSVCIKSVIENTDLPFNLTIIDNSVGAIDHLLNDLPETIRVIRNEENIGKGRSFKRWYKSIIQNRTPEYIISLDCDIKVPKNWLSTLLRATYKIKQPIGALAPVLLSDETDSFDNHLMQKNLKMHGGERGYEVAKEISQGVYSNKLTAGSLFLINKQFYDEIGGYPGTSLFGHDDGFICGKAISKNRFIGFTSDLQCIHLNQDDTPEYKTWKTINLNKAEVRSGYWDQSDNHDKTD